MSKKKLILKESVTRRFMRLAEIESKFTDQFLTELGEEEMEMGGPEMGGEEEFPGDEAPEEELPDEEVGATVEVDPNELVSDIVAALQKQGADVSMDGAEEEAPEGEELAPIPGEEELPAEAPEDELMQELDKANVKVADDEATINEVARRVAARLVAANKRRRR
jgi:hypothetical protein